MTCTWYDMHLEKKRSSPFNTKRSGPARLPLAGLWRTPGWLCLLKSAREEGLQQCTAQL